MNTAAAETARQVADIISFRPDEFGMLYWDTSNWDTQPECGTTRCIAGWVGELHQDAYTNLPRREMSSSGTCVSDRDHDDWLYRQAQRLGIDKASALFLFFSNYPPFVLDAGLRTMAKELERPETDQQLSVRQVLEIFTAELCRHEREQTT